MMKHKGLYTEQNDVQIGVLTWNCAGNPPPANFDIRDVLYDPNQEMADIYVVGLQEMVQLNTSQVVVGKDK